MDEQMRVDSESVKRLREERSWSQEHLAAVTGVSLRTIQRVESEGTGSPETRLALAAAFGVTAASLMPRTQAPLVPGALARHFPGKPLGIVCGSSSAVLGITSALMGVAGVSLGPGIGAGLLGAWAGVTCAIAGMVCNRRPAG